MRFLVLRKSKDIEKDREDISFHAQEKYIESSRTEDKIY